MLTKALNARKARLQEEKGFTLIELLAVIVILGIIAVIAIPMIGKIIDNSKKDSDAATARQIYDAARLYVIGENKGDFKKASTVTLEQLQKGKYLEANIALPSTKKALDGTKTKVEFKEDGTLSKVTLDPPAENSTGEYSADQVLGVEAAKPE